MTRYLGVFGQGGSPGGLVGIVLLRRVRIDVLLFLGFIRRIRFAQPKIQGSCALSLSLQNFRLGRLQLVAGLRRLLLLRQISMSRQNTLQLLVVREQWGFARTGTNVCIPSA